MKLAILTYIFLGFLTAFGNDDFPEKDDFKTSAQIMQEKKISDKDLCELACETKFTKCYDKKKQSGFKCAANAVTCKNKCK